MENREEEGVKVLEAAYKEYITYLPYLHNQVSKRRWKGVITGEITVEECGPSVFICLTKRIGKIEITFGVGTWQDYKDVGDTMVFTEIHNGVYVDVDEGYGKHSEITNKFISIIENALVREHEFHIKRRNQYFCYDVTPFKPLNLFLEMLDVVTPLYNSFNFDLPKFPLSLPLDFSDEEESFQYIEESLQLFNEKGHNIVYETLIHLRELISTNRWENVSLDNISYINDNGISLNFHYGLISVEVSIKENVRLKAVNYDYTNKTNVISLRAYTSNEKITRPLSYVREVISSIAQGFKSLDLSIHTDSIIIKEPTNKAMDVFFRLCDLASQIQVNLVM